MALNLDAIAIRWAESVRDGKYDSYESSQRMYFRGDTIYSYGSHFPIATAYRKPNGKLDYILLNGDRFSVSTTNHQGKVWWAIRLRLGNVPQVTIPFSVLNQSGIIKSTIEIVDAKPEGRDYTLTRSKNPPEGFVAVGDMEEFLCLNEKASHVSRDKVLADPTIVGYYVPTEARFYRQVVRFDGATYSWYSVRHWLGDALISAKLVRPRGRRVKFLSSFDRQERNRLYFFCQLPPTSATTVEEAIEALKPEPVRLAELSGREVTRQGDMFAVPVPSVSKRDLTKWGATYSGRSKILAWSKTKQNIEVARRASLIGTSHVGTEVATLPDGTQYARGSMYHMPQFVENSWRRPDHARRQMGDGKTWHLIVKNTVPVADMARRGARVNGSLAA